MTLAVIATGNHYLVDVAAGLLVTGVAYGVTRLIDRPTWAPDESARPFL